jgi:DNA-binding transcriptional LysR family regulator
MSDIQIQMRELDLNLLRAFRTLVTESSVTRAADRLGISQPAMSTLLRSLREHFSDPILTRAPGGSVPTPRALVLLESVGEILEGVARLKGPGFDRQRIHEMRGRVCVAATDYVQQLLVPQLIARTAAEAPALQIELRLANKANLKAWMERGEVDLGVGPAIVPTGRLHFRAVFRDSAVTIMNESLARNCKRLTLERYCELDHLRIAPNSPHSSEGAFYDEAIERELDKRRLKRKVVLTMQHFLSVPSVVARCDVVATVPSRLLNDIPESFGLSVREPVLPLPDMVIGLFWHKRAHQDPLQRWFRDVVRGVLQVMK